MINFCTFLVFIFFNVPFTLVEPMAFNIVEVLGKKFMKLLTSNVLLIKFFFIKLCTRMHCSLKMKQIFLYIKYTV